MKVCSVSLNKSHLGQLRMFFTWDNKKVVSLYTSGLFEDSYSQYSSNIDGVHSYIDDQFENNDIFLEFPFSFAYEYIQEKYPETKFIYIDIEKEVWINQMGVLKELYSHNKDPYVFEEFFCNHYFETGKTKIQDLTADELAQIYDHHKSGINNFFAEKNNFIKIDYNSQEILETVQAFVSQ